MAELNFPPPVDHQEFERLIVELAGPTLRAFHVNLNGRTGQKQQGVDVSATMPDGSEVGIQCKLVSLRLTIETVRAEIIKAREYKPSLNRFIMATTAPSDARLQESVRLLPEEPFSVEIWDWGQINNYLNRYGPLGLAYAQNVMMGPAAVAEEQHAQYLREAIDRPAFLRVSHAERDFMAQQEAIKNTSAFLRTGYLYTRDGRFVNGLPYLRYSEGYSLLLSSVVKSVDAIDVYLSRHMASLLDNAVAGHARSLIGLETKRLAVLSAANRLFAVYGIPQLTP